MSRSFISILCGLFLYIGNAQKGPIDTRPRDTVGYEQPYGIRVGIDLSRPLLSFLNDGYTGLEFVGDYRLTQNIYLAGELGNEKKTRQEDLYNFTTSGSYLKLGIDYNTYANWYGEQNSIFIGGRYAFSTFSQTLHEYRIFDTNRYWNSDDFAIGSTEAMEFGGRHASWLEFVLGTKVELFKNLYLGGSLRLGFLVSNKKSDEFPNLFIPGFNKVTDGSRFGVGYNYSISYSIPFYKKAKKDKAKDPEEESQENP